MKYIVENRKKNMLELLCWALFCGQLLVGNVYGHSIIYQIIAIIFIITCFIYSIIKTGIIINTYHIISIIFAVYSFILIFIINLNINESLSSLKTYIINLIIYILCYNLFICTKNTDKIFNSYIYVSLISNFIILFVFRNSLFEGRLGFSWQEKLSGYQFLGFDISTPGPNGIGFYSALSFLMCLYYIHKKNKKSLYFVYCIIFIFTILLTGSRKTLIILLIGLIGLANICSHRNNKFKKFLIILCIIIISYFLFVNIPYLYNNYLLRLRGLLNFITKSGKTDSSINTRMILINFAIKYIKQKPILGYGIGSFKILNPLGIVADNNFLEILFSTGLIGLIIYYLHVFFVFINYRVIKNKSHTVKFAMLLFVILLICEFISTTYLVRLYGLIYTIIYYILNNERKIFK